MKAIVAISDLHIGSHSGLIPGDGLVTHEGNVVKPNKFQRTTLKYWDDFWGEFVPRHTKGCKKIAIVINGDIIDGVHHNTTYIVTNSWQKQENAAVEFLKPIRDRTDKFYVVRGTESHTGQCSESEERIAKTLGAVSVKDGRKEEFTSWQWWIDCDGVLFQFAHHIGTTSSAAYETSAPMRELVGGLVENAQWNRRLPDVMVRSHRHRFNEVSIPSPRGRIRCVITPGWQVKTPFVERLDRMRMPHIGGVVFLCEDGSCETKEKIYPMPLPKIQTV